MKRLLIILGLIVPALTFGQLSKQEKKQIKNYANDMCSCVDDLINTLHPAAVEYLTVLFNEGETKAAEYLNGYQSTAKEADISALNASFEAMQQESFGNGIEDCDDKGEMSNKVARDIDNQFGEAHDYFLEMLEEGKNCFMLRNFYLMGISAE